MKRLESSGVHVLGVEEPDIVLAVFQGAARTADIRAMQAALEGEASARPGRKLAVVVLIGHGSTLGRSGRQAIAEMMTAAGAYSSAWSIIIEGQGFWAASARSVTAVTLSLARNTYPVHVDADIEAGLSWLGGRLKAPLPKSLRDSIESLRPRPGEGRSAEPETQAVASVRLTGHLTRSVLATALSSLKPRIERAGTFGMIVDASEMTSYDADARADFVDWNREHRSRIVATAVVIRNPLWRMVVQAMSVASGQRMAAFSTLPEAEAWLRDGATRPSSPAPGRGGG